MEAGAVTHRAAPRSGLCRSFDPIKPVRFSPIPAEDVLGKHPVSPGAFVPIREQLGNLLLQIGQPKQAQAEFEAALKIYPGRFKGLYGAAQAAELTGDNEKASRYYTKLAAQTSKAGGSRDELNHVREFLSAQAKAADSNGVASARE